MKNRVSIPNNKNQLNIILYDNYSYVEPNIRKAQFVMPSNKQYTLEFDQNIKMEELKIMIQKAAHLRKNTFNLYCKGVDYTPYNSETFDSLFPGQNLVIFTLELLNGSEDFNETELLLQINMPCPEHNYKFLFYYCFDCGKSICSECFTNGPHKGHKIQDKCFYLLPTKYLVEKMFENWSKKPYEDYQISVNLNEYKNNLNNIIFKNLFQMLQEVQKKCNDLIDKYNTINQNSLSNIRDSVRDIKISCIKALDEYKDLINIKDIINNEEVFIDFDHTYKDMGNKQKEKFKENLLKFQELNKTISILVENLINDICEMIKDILIKANDDKQYIDIEQKINLKLIKPVNKDDIINQLSDKKIRIIKNQKFERKTINIYNKFIGQISEGIENELENNKNNNNNKRRNTIYVDNNGIDYDDEGLLSYGKMNNINNVLNNNINNINRNKKNYSIDSTLKKPVGSSVCENNIENKNNMTQLLNNSNTNYTNNKYINDFNQNNNNSILSNQNPNEKTYSNFNTSTNINQSFGLNTITGLKNNNDNTDNSSIQINNNDQNKNNINENPFFQPKKQNAQMINDINMNQNGKDVNNNINDRKSTNIFGSILDNNKNNDNNNNIFNRVSEKKTNSPLNIFSGNDISPIVDNKVLNSNNDIFSNNSSFINDINNNNSEQSNRDNIKMNMNMNMTDNNKNQNPFLPNNLNNNNQISFNENSNPQNITLSSPFTAININKNSNNINNSFNSNQNKNSNDNISSQNINKTDNINANNDKNKMLIISDITSKYLAGLAHNCKTILEEANESESDIKTQKERKINIEYYLNKNYILCPIPTTNKLKIITDEEKDESIMSITFPSNLNISQFLYNCAHCNHNKKLYISGGILNKNSSPKLSTNIFYMIDLNKLININNNNNKNDVSSCITELSSMIYSRTNHSMIAYNNEIFAVGGEDNNTVEKYDILKDSWIEISSLIKKRSNAMLAIENGYLYVFFGKGEDGKYPQSIERLNIANNNSVFEMILYSNPNNIDTRLYGCGLFQIDELIYFLGGKCNEKNIDEIFFFNFNDRRFDVTDSKLKWKESFRENQLFKLGNNIVQICDGKFFGVYLKIVVK